MIFVQFAVVLLFILIGARLGGLGIGYAGGAGVIVLGLMGLKVDVMTGVPWEVLGIILSVIVCIAAMQAAGGLDWLVAVTERLLRRNPKQITYWAPIVTYLMTVFCGTGHVAFSSLPVIAEVAGHYGVAPVKVAQAALLGQMTTGFPVSPLTPATFLVAGLSGIELGAHQRFSIPWLFGASLVMTGSAVLFGVLA